MYSITCGNRPKLPHSLTIVQYKVTLVSVGHFSKWNEISQILDLPLQLNQLKQKQQQHKTDVR